MSNKPQEKVRIIREWFLRVIRERKKTVEELGNIPEIDRSGKTIQRCLSSGEMQPDLLDRIGKALNVDPNYLSGEYYKCFLESKDSLPNTDASYYLLTKIDRYPYQKYQAASINYEEYLINTLLINNISKEQFLSLDSRKRRSLQFDIGMALKDVISNYFEKDSQGIETNIGASGGLTLLIGGDWIKE